MSAEAEAEAVKVAMTTTQGLTARWLLGSDLIKVSQALINVVAERDELRVSVTALTEAISDGSMERDKLIAEREEWRARAEALANAKTPYEHELARCAVNLPSVDLMPCRYEIRIHEPSKTSNWVWSTHNDYARACAEFEAYADLACERDPKDLPGTLVELRDLGEDRISSMTINDMTCGEVG